MWIFGTDGLQGRAGRHPACFFSHSHDLLGDRMQILDRWLDGVHSNVPVGTKVSPVGHIDFGVVKDYESCP